jgi:tetratricopeptide (TPR) repeat protein
MKIGVGWFAVVTVMTLQAPAAWAHQATSAGERIGQVSFPVSCNPAVQKPFERSVALLHSFWYLESAKAFTAVTQADPDCTMAYWGIAMSLWYQIWSPPSPANLKRGAEAIEKAKSLGAKTQRERDYIAAADAFYRDADRLDHRTRAAAYEKAMEEVFLRYPQDTEAAAFYALALQATADPHDRTYAKQRRSAEIVEKIFIVQPDHPGAAHYIIHAYDYAPLAQRAVPAAERYAQFAPSVPHALHMPSHTYVLLGMWPETIRSNVAAAAAEKDRGNPDDRMHALGYLVYETEEGTEKHNITPGPIVTARELLGDLLIDMGQPGVAVREYEASLNRAPNRFKTLAGIAKAAELSADRDKARIFYGRLLLLAQPTDAERPELKHAKVVVGAPR